MANSLDVAAHAPTISNPNSDEPARTPTPAAGTRVEHMPSTGAGAIYHADEDRLVVHSAPGSEALTASSHDMSGQVDFKEQTARLAASVTEAQKRLDAASPADRAQAQRQLERATERAMVGFAHLEQIAKNRK